MVRSPTLFRVKGRRGLERLGHEWTELALLAPKLRKRFGAGRYRPVFLDHHLCHAASSFLVSPFERAAILVVDGASEAHTAMTRMADRKSTRLNSSHDQISYAVFCLKK